jgi:hypothetical protein
MGNAWFETVAEAQRRAKKRLPASVYGENSISPVVIARSWSPAG